jgi:hypothetical protein
LYSGSTRRRWGRSETELPFLSPQVMYTFYKFEWRTFGWAVIAEPLVV